MSTDTSDDTDDAWSSELEVETLRRTSKADELVCQTARGDYYDGAVHEVSARELLETVSYDDKHREWAEDFLSERGRALSYSAEHYARQYAFLERLYRRGHFGPWEHPQITFSVKDASRTCMAQITRHRHASFDVQSQRYVNFGVKDEPVKTPKSLADPDHFSRETGTVELDELDREFYAEHYQEKARELVHLYNNMVQNGVPKEDARFILPTGTKVNWTMSMNARCLLHLADMRAAADAQWEARELANLVLEEFAEWMPISYAVHEEHGPNKLAP